MPEIFRLNGRQLDLSTRVVQSTAVTGSPALAAETIVATSPAIDGYVPIALGCLIIATMAYTIGTSGTACTVRIRQTGLAGTVIYSTGAMTGGHNTAGQLVSDDVNGFDTAPAAGQVYVATLQVTAGAAASTVSAANIIVIVI